MKTISSLDFCRIACSTDKARPNLCLVYSKAGRPVGTDGHRLHLGEKNGDFTGYLTGKCDIDFPNFEHVFPTSSSTIASLRIDADLVKSLKALCAVVPKANAPVKFEFYDKYAELSFRKDDSLSWCVKIDYVLERIPIKTSVAIRFNPHYLVDAFDGFVRLDSLNYRVALSVDVTVAQPFDEVYLSAVVFEAMDHKALIMPMRLS